MLVFTEVKRCQIAKILVDILLPGYNIMLIFPPTYDFFQTGLGKEWAEGNFL